MRLRATGFTFSQRNPRYYETVGRSILTDSGPPHGALSLLMGTGGPSWRAPKSGRGLGASLGICRLHLRHHIRDGLRVANQAEEHGAHVETGGAS